MAASDYVPIFFKKPLALGGASTDENREYFFAIWRSLAPASQVPCCGSFH